MSDFFCDALDIAHQALLSMDFPVKNIGVGCHFLPSPGIEPASPALAGGVFTPESPGKLIFALQKIPSNVLQSEITDPMWKLEI